MADHQFAAGLHRELKGFGVVGFLDKADLTSGSAISGYLRDAMEQSHSIIVILSPEAMNSRWVMAEIGMAQMLGKEIFSVLAPGKTFADSVPDILENHSAISGDIPIWEVATKLIAAQQGIDEDDCTCCHFGARHFSYSALDGNDLTNGWIGTIRSPGYQASISVYLYRNFSILKLGFLQQKLNYQLPKKIKISLIVGHTVIFHIAAIYTF
jgi:hypothetical protein